MSLANVGLQNKSIWLQNYLTFMRHINRTSVRMSAVNKYTPQTKRKKSQNTRSELGKPDFKKQLRKEREKSPNIRSAFCLLNFIKAE